MILARGLKRGVRFNPFVAFTAVKENAARLMLGAAFAFVISPATGATVPDSPVLIGVTPGVNSVTVAFAAPANDGGSPISSYTVNCGTYYSTNGAASPITVSGMPAGTPVTCNVRANNYLGASTPSLPSASVVPQSANATLYMQSQQGDYVGGGQTRHIKPSDNFTFSATVNAVNAVNNGLTVSFSSPTNNYSSPLGYNWGLNLRAADMQPLVAGDYPDAGRSFSQPPSRPTLDFYGNSNGCSQSFGNFRIHEISIDAGNHLLSLAVDFEHHCENAPAATFGQVRFNSNVPVDLAFRHIQPITLVSVLDAPLSSTLTSISAVISGINVVLPVSITGGEYSLDGGAFTAAAGTVVNGQSIRVRVTSAATPNTLSVATLDIGGLKIPFKVGTAAGVDLQPNPNGDPLIVVVGQPVSQPGTATRSIFGPATLANIVLLAGSSGEVVVNAQPIGQYYPTFSATIAGPNNAPLAVGAYLNIVPGVSMANGSLTTYNVPGCGYTTVATVRFVVHEVEYLPSGLASKLALDYVQGCTISSNAAQSVVYGYIRFNSSVPIDYSMSTPIPFKFPFVADAAQATAVVSATATVGGVNVPIPVSVAGGEYSIDGGAFTAAAGTVTNGQTLRVRLTSAATPNTLTTATITLNELVVPFKVGTALGSNPQPNDGSIIALTGYSSSPTQPVTTRILSPARNARLTLSRDYYSANTYGPLTVTAEEPTNNFGTDVWSATLAGPNNSALAVGTYTDATTSGTSTTARIYVNGTPNCQYSDGARATIIVHEIAYLPDGMPAKLAADFVYRCNRNDSYSSTDVIGFIRVNSTVPVSHAIDLPAPFAFADVTGAAPGTQVVSSEPSILGITVPVPISVSGGEYSLDDGPFTSLAGVVNGGQRVKLRVTTPAQSNVLVTAALTVGVRSASFTVGTAPAVNQQPNGSSPLIVLVGANQTSGILPPMVLSPATLHSISLLPPSYSSALARIQATRTYLTWEAFTSGPNRAALLPGTYTGAVSDSSLLASPSFHSYFNSYEQPVSMSCIGQPYRTDFTVHEVEYSITGAFIKLALDFHSVCTGNPLATIVHGYIRVNSSVAIDYTLRRPIAPAFLQARNVALGAVVESNEVEIQGINVAVPISVTGGEYSIDGGAYTSAAGTIVAGQKVKVRGSASMQYNALTTAHLTVGESASDFRIGTLPGANPQANGGPLLYLVSQGGEILGRGLNYVHSPATGSTFSIGHPNGNRVFFGASGPAPEGYFVSPENWSFEFSTPDGSQLVPTTYNPASLNPSPITGTAGLYPLHSSTTCGNTGQFTVHEVSYTATTIDKLAIDFVNYCNGYPDPLYGYIRFNSSVPVAAIADTKPTPFWFGPQYNVARSAVITSNALTPGGFTVPASVTISGGEYSIDGGAFTSAPGTINPGQSVRLRVTSPATFGTEYGAILTVGGISGFFVITTEYQDTYPNPIVLGAVVNAALNSWIYSAIVTVGGINSPVPVTINGGEFSVGGRPFTSAPSAIQPGETIQVRIMSSSAYYDYRLALLTVGLQGAQFSVQTIAQVQLQVIVSGAGSVSSSPGSIVCPSTCSQSFLYGTSVTFTPTPAPGMKFNGWTSGDCITAGIGSCTLTVTTAQTISAAFIPAPPGKPVITSVTPGNGQATVSFVPAPLPGPGALAASYYEVVCGGVYRTGTTSTITVTGLTNGIAVACTVGAVNGSGTSAPSDAVSVTPSAVVATALVGVQSRKSHGATINIGTFELPVDTRASIGGAITIEPRSIGSGHQIVFQFNTAVTATNVAVVDGNGVTVTPSFVTTLDNEVTVGFTALPDKTRLAITLSGVNGTLTTAAAIGFLVGDVNASRTVGSDDSSAVKVRSGQMVNSDNFLFNISNSGTIGAADIATVKARVGNSLP